MFCVLEKYYGLDGFRLVVFSSVFTDEKTAFLRACIRRRQLNSHWVVKVLRLSVRDEYFV